MNQKELEIDLNSFHPTSEVIGEFTVDRVKVKKLFTIVEKDSLYDKIEISNVSIPTSLHLNDPDNFISIRCNRLGLPALKRHLNIPIKTNRLKFSILADISKIQNVVLGATDNKDTFEEVKINFNLSQKCSEFKINREIPYILVLKIKPYRAQLIIKYDANKDAFEYQEELRHHIGNLQFSTKKIYGYYYHDNFRVDLRVIGNTDKEAIAVDLENIYQKLLSETSVTVPVYCQTAFVPNPLESMTIKGRLYLDTPTVFDPPEFSVTILPDSSKTELQVAVVDDDVLVNGKDYTLQHSVKWLGKSKRGRMTCFELAVANLAQSGDGIIKVRNFRMDTSYDNTKIALVDGVVDLFEIDQEQSFELENVKNSRKKVKISFRHDNIIKIDQLNQKVTVSISFEYALTKARSSQEDSISELFFCTHCYKTKKLHVVRLIPSPDKDCPSCGKSESTFLKLAADHGYQEFESLRQSYLGDKTVDYQSNLNWTIFKASVSFNLEEHTGDTWLAIDFGTSASVVAIADADTLQRKRQEDIFINMNDALFRLYDQKYHEYNFGEKSDNNIISSEILFRTSVSDQKSFLKSSNYFDDVIHISPPREILKEYFAFSVPYLKSLIGFDTIPDISGTYEKLEYYPDTSSVHPVSFKERPLSVKDVLKNVYNSLLRDFVKPQLNGNITDKIIFSVPNTFTPKQVEIIKEIVRKHFPNFRPEFTSFISESDAVACEYIANWHEHNADRPDKDQIRQQDEYVIVYDVGAGTSDLTLFMISKASNDKNRELRILGKLGKGTAGNYLDYLIAQIIDKMGLSSEKMTNQEGFNPIAHSNKDFIKSFIKPNLHRPDMQFYILPDGTLRETETPDSKEIYIGAIIDDPLVGDYLEANSTEIIEQFFKLFAGTDPNISAESNHTNIHTIIFSGRGVLFKNLRDSFRNALKEFVSNEYEPYIIFQNDSEKLKSVVVTGALNYAVEFRNEDLSSVKVTSRNLVARYGFLYKNPEDDKWEFLEVLNPSTDHLNLIPHNVSGLSVFEYDTDKKNAQGDPSKMYIDLSSTSVGYFVQSYSDNTARDFNQKKWDYITIMFSFQKGNITTKGNVKKVRVRVRINKDNQMSVTVGREENDFRDPLKIDFSNDTFKKSLWPYV